MPRLSAFQQNEAVGMIIGGATRADVAGRYGCTRMVIHNVVHRHQNTGAVAGGTRSGRPRVTTPSPDRHIRLTHLRNRFRPANETAQEIQGRTNPRISSETAWRRQQKSGMRAYRTLGEKPWTDQRRATRRRWCQRCSVWSV
jgi:transposase